MVFYILLISIFLLLFSKSATIIIIKLKNYLIPFVIILLMICTMIFSKSSVQATKESISLWYKNVLPSLFPFFIMIELLKESNFLRFFSQILTPVMKPLFGVPRKWSFCIINGNYLWLPSRCQSFY